MIVAGEASADLHASNLVRELKKLDPGLEIYGVGSDKLKETGAHIWYDFSRKSVVGILETVPQLKFFWDARNRLLDSIASEKPDLIVLLDLPGFNLHFSRKIKERYPGQKIIYYISPQVWAWGTRRVKKIKKHVDLMLAILPFEEKFYQSHGVPVKFVGHPLMQVVKPSKSREELRKEFGVKPDELMLAFLPGSRKVELGHYVPSSFKAIARLQKEFPLKAFFAQAPTIKKELIDQYVAKYPVNIEVVSGRTYDILFASDLGLLGSGTATLEATLAELPMLIMGKLLWINVFILLIFIRVFRVGLPNLIAGKKIVPELLMTQVNSYTIARVLRKIITDKEYRERMKSELVKTHAEFGTQNASQVAAAEILKMLNR
jgi:lipid-A-disaccharide synthase